MIENQKYTLNEILSFFNKCYIKNLITNTILDDKYTRDLN